MDTMEVIDLNPICVQISSSLEHQLRFNGLDILNSKWSFQASNDDSFVVTLKWSKELSTSTTFKSNSCEKQEKPRKSRRTRKRDRRRLANYLQRKASQILSCETIQKYSTNSDDGIKNVSIENEHTTRTDRSTSQILKCDDEKEVRDSPKEDDTSNSTFIFRDPLINHVIESQQNSFSNNSEQNVNLPLTVQQQEVDKTSQQSAEENLSDVAHADSEIDKVLGHMFKNHRKVCITPVIISRSHSSATRRCLAPVTVLWDNESQLRDLVEWYCRAKLNSVAKVDDISVFFVSPSHTRYRLRTFDDLKIGDLIPTLDISHLEFEWC